MERHNSTDLNGYNGPSERVSVSMEDLSIIYELGKLKGAAFFHVTSGSITRDDARQIYGPDIKELLSRVPEELLIRLAKSVWDDLGHKLIIEDRRPNRMSGLQVPDNRD